METKSLEIRGGGGRLLDICAHVNKDKDSCAQDQMNCSFGA